MEVKPETVQGVRKLLEDILAPGVARLEAKFENLGERCVELAGNIERDRVDIKEIWQELAGLKERFGRFEGRVEGIRRELVAEIKLDLIQTFQPNRRLPQAGDES